MVKKGTKRSNNDILRIITLAQSGAEQSNTGYVDDLQYYQGEDSIFKAQQIASKMPEGKANELINLIKESNAKMEEASHGGYRPGAGRKPTGRSKKQIYVTDEEFVQVQELIKKLRDD